MDAVRRGCVPSTDFVCLKRLSVQKLHVTKIVGG
jgi:hypothetical protein